MLHKLKNIKIPLLVDKIMITFVTQIKLYCLLLFNIKEDIGKVKVPLTEKLRIP